MIHEKFNGIHGAINYYHEPALAEFPTIVFLSGLYSGSDYYAMKSMAGHIQGPFGKVFVDFLGRGESAETDVPRTNANITDELHEFIEQVIGEPVIFFVQGMSGVYVVDFIDKFAELVYGVIGIEPMTGVVGEYENQPAYQAVQFATMTTEEQAVVLEDSELTAAEKAMAKELERPVTAGTVQDEMQRAEDNTHAIRNKNIPDGVPVLLFTEPYRLEEYKNSEYANGNTKYIELEGSHHLHSDEIALRTNEWIAMSLLSGGQPSV
ncbi:alpha/beta hydrolase [Periweissella cryptocerci]|uniref:Alpha/beta hydrolase n=1 Tax=Periweissella cryptocerci TaxID=2506420 RepID=A0A4P6YU18_9LACO|nr:alpha/beta hydrolase [Periweissella cryptocerci]QBO36210.1 alpha/beta hydrolase [Periweissella cryptocerci]